MAGVGTVVLASDYNGIQTKISGVLGVGSGNTGYNQTVTSAQIGSTDPIRATHWSTLRYDILRARQHQTGTDQSANLQNIVSGASASFTGYISGTTLTIVGTPTGTIQRGMAVYGGSTLPGTVITGGSGTSWSLLVSGAATSQSVGTVISNVSFTAYLVVTDLMLTEFNNMADACITNALTVGAGEITTGEAFSTATRTTAWNGTLTNTVTVTFPSATAARSYFNAGGSFRITASRTGGTSVGGAATKNAIWTAMISSDTVTYPSAIGTVIMNYNTTTRSGTGTAFAIGFYGLTSSPQTIINKPAPAGVYSDNFYVIQAYCNVASNATGGATQVIFSIQFQDLDVGDRPVPSPPPPYGPLVDESPDGTLVSAVGMGRPTGTNVSIAAPTVTQTGF
jgi:hypothetical protein